MDNLSKEDVERLVKIARTLAELDWCAGYSIRSNDHAKLDDARLDAIDFFNGHGDWLNADQSGVS